MPKHAKHTNGYSLEGQGVEAPTTAIGQDGGAPTSVIGQAVESPTASIPAYEEYRKYARGSWTPGNENAKPVLPVFPEKKKRKWPKALGTLAVVFALGAVGLFAYFAMLDNVLAGDSSQRKSLELQLSDRKSDEPYYVLVLGSDAHEENGDWENPQITSASELSDLMLVVRVDEKNKQISMLSIPRDTPVEIDGKIYKINHAYMFGGASKSVEVISKLTGIPISHYAEVHISDFEAIVDEVGGIDFDVPVDISVRDTITGEGSWVPAGQQHLTGKQAQVLARARSQYEDGDVSRQRIIRDMVFAIAKAALSKPLHEIPGTVMNVAEHINTNLKSLDLILLASHFADDIDGLTVYSGSGPTSGNWRHDLDGNWYCYDNPEGWAAVTKVFKEGGDPSTVDANSYAIIPADSE